MKERLKKLYIYKLFNFCRTKIKIYFNYKFNLNTSDSAINESNLSDVFKNIYLSKKWGDPDKLGIITDNNPYFSGTGSYTTPADEYVNFIIDFVKKNNISSILDIGCGDFSIGNRITSELPGVLYLGVDIFDEIIDFNKKKYGTNNIDFKKIDTTLNKVPNAELLLIREVFQHLSNNSISKIIKIQFNDFKFKLITECIPPKDFFTTYNLDKPDGPGTRLSQGSGIYLDKPPFNLDIELKLKCKHPYFGEINTYLVTN